VWPQAAPPANYRVSHEASDVDTPVWPVGGLGTPGRGYRDTVIASQSSIADTTGYDNAEKVPPILIHRRQETWGTMFVLLARQGGRSQIRTEPDPARMPTTRASGEAP